LNNITLISIFLFALLFQQFGIRAICFLACGEQPIVKMSDLQIVGGVKKLNNQNNNNSWSTCIMSYMQGQDLWDVVNGSEATQPEAEDVHGTLRK